MFSIRLPFGADETWPGGNPGDSMDAAASFVEKVAQCLRLAASVTDDRTVRALLALAEKYDALAAEYAARERGEADEG